MLDFVLLDVLASAGATEPPSEFRLFRAGPNETRKGVFLFDAKAAEQVAANADDWGVDHTIDYGHGMFNVFASDPAEAGKAAGWFRPAVRNGELWATDVRWTEAAAAKIRAREFRYVSPAFATDKDRRVVQLHNVAITNIPATKRADPLVALSLLDCSPLANEPGANEGTRFHMEQFAIMLGLAKTASESEIMAAISALAAPVAELRALTGKVNPSEALGVVRAWKSGADSVETLSTELGKLRASAFAREVDAAIADGRLAPAQREWCLSYGAKDADGARAFLANAPKLLALGHEHSEPGKGAQGGKGPGANQVSEIELSVLSKCGVTPEAYTANRERLAKLGLVNLSVIG